MSTNWSLLWCLWYVLISLIRLQFWASKEILYMGLSSFNMTGLEKNCSLKSNPLIIACWQRDLVLMRWERNQKKGKRCVLIHHTHTERISWVLRSGPTTVQEIQSFSYTFAAKYMIKELFFNIYFISSITEIDEVQFLDILFIHIFLVLIGELCNYCCELF